MSTSKMSNLLKRTIFGLILVTIVSGSILLSEYSMLGLVMLIYVLGTVELHKLIALKGNTITLFSSLAGILIIGVTYLATAGLIPLYALAVMLIVLLTLAIFIYVIAGKNSYTSVASMFFGGLWIAVSLSLYAALGWQNETGVYDPTMLLIVIILIWVNDIGAFLVGSFIGKNPLAPSISPGKTWEGFISGIVLTMIGGILVYRITLTYSLYHWIILSILISLGATIGDLFESKIKREYGAKDSGNIIPGHGGILDRFDSLFFSAPLVYLVLIITEMI